MAKKATKKQTAIAFSLTNTIYKFHVPTFSAYERITMQKAYNAVTKPSIPVHHVNPDFLPASPVIESPAAPKVVLRDTTSKDADLRKDGKPRYSTSGLASAPVPAEGIKTKIYNMDERHALLSIIFSRTLDGKGMANVYAGNQDVFVNYWPSRNIYTFSSAKDEKGYRTEKGAFKFAAISCDETGIADASTIRFTNIRKDL